MFNQFGRHIKEFLGYLQNHQYEQSPEGILFPKAGVFARGIYKDFANSELLGITPNLIVAQGLNHMLSVALLGGSQIAAASWYLGLGSGGTTPAASWTGANVASNFSEITSTSQGYSEVNRQAFTGAADTGNSSVSNVASKASFTIAASAPPLSVTGAFLVGSDNTRGGTTGTLLSAVKFASARSLSDGDDYEIQYEVDLNTP